jgi:glycosyltransferase involved in cell wall biosynthesis
MNKLVWLIYSTDALPGESGFKHAENLASFLSDNGYKVIWWNSNFSHTLKKFRSKDLSGSLLKKGVTLKLIPTMGYKHHIGFARILSLIVFYFRLYWVARKEPRPSVIIKSSPDIFGEPFTVALANYFACPLILDFRDLWPEVFRLALPKKIRELDKYIFSPFYSLRKWAFNRADGIVAVSKDYLDLAKIIAPSLREKPSAISYHCNFSALEINKRSINAISDVKFISNSAVEIVYVGTLGNNYDIQTLLDALVIAEKKLNLNLVVRIAGDGPLRDAIQEHINKRLSANVEYLGLLAREQIERLYSKAEIALVLYAKDSTVSMPAKSYELMFHGLPVITSIGREYGHLVDCHCFGFRYSPGDADSLAKALQDATQNREKLCAMGARSLNLIEDYAQEVQLGKYLEVIKSVTQCV